MDISTVKLVIGLVDDGEPERGERNLPLLSDAKLLDSFKILLIGPSGVGKSIAASDFYRLGKVHFSDFDGRLKPVVNYHKNNPEALANISYESYPSLKFHDFLIWLDNIQKPPGPKFKTWVLDSVTSCSNTAIVYQLVKKDKIKVSKAGLPVTSWDEINAETVFFTMLLEASNYLNEEFGTNIIWIAHPVSKTETVNPGELSQESKRYEAIASYGYKIPSLIPTKFDEIYRMKVEKVGVDFRRVALTSLANSEEVLAKTALDLPGKINVGEGLYKAIIDNIIKKKEEQVQVKIEEKK